ncbi:MAG: succinate dehydrogenase, cytochrome b556 subunit [Herpetosiphonaceae bacterium]|nr:succinate dehydrogenase, cytochrome b556 subunit [Herpetosiphonaceae bacterium]
MNRTIGDRYRGGVGMLAWLLHRLSGLALVGYLLLHLYDLRAAQQSKAAFDQALAFFQTPFWKIMDLLLVAVVLYHTLNGIRLLLFDSGSTRAIRYQRQLFWLAFGLTIAIFLFSAVMVFTHLPSISTATSG